MQIEFPIPKLLLSLVNLTSFRKSGLNISLFYLQNPVYANQQMSMDEMREIKQFHYIGWPDMGVPEYATPVLAFIDVVNRSNPGDVGPIVVHCRYIVRW